MSLVSDCNFENSNKVVTGPDFDRRLDVLLEKGKEMSDRVDNLLCMIKDVSQKVDNVKSWLCKKRQYHIKRPYERRRRAITNVRSRKVPTQANIKYVKTYLKRLNTLQ